MPRDDFEDIKVKVGGFMSIKSLLSTSQNRNVALMFSGSSSTDTSSVLLEINIDIEKCKTPFADVTMESQFDQEQEILFTLGAIFRIQSVQQNHDGLWIVKLSLTGEEDQELRVLTERMRKEIIWPSPSRSLCSLMTQMACYDKAEYYLTLLLQDSSINEDLNSLAGVYNSL
jgi:hypothetical protein